MIRKAAFRILQEWEAGESYAADLIGREAARNDLPARERAGIQQLVYAVIRNQRLLDEVIASLATGKLDPKTRRILRLGLTEALLLNSAPHALVNEWVSFAKWSRGVVNAILRRALREKEPLLLAIEQYPPPVRYSIPDHLWKRWVRHHGEEAAMALARWNHQPAPVYLRLNPLKPGGHPLVLDYPEISSAAAPGFVEIAGPIPPEWIEQGWVYATDPSTLTAPALAAAQPGETVLDACAAPGGKTLSLAAAMEGQGCIVAVDRAEPRLDRLRANLGRTGVSMAQPVAFDWLGDAAWPGDLPQQFDRVLADVPCSNTGVIRRRIDVPWRLRKGEFASLAEVQQALLGRLAPHVRSGGVLIYSTCSIDPEENDDVVQAFLAAHPNFSLEARAEILPWLHQMDGAFAAALRHGHG